MGWNPKKDLEKLKKRLKKKAKKARERREREVRKALNAKKPVPVPGGLTPPAPPVNVGPAEPLKRIADARDELKRLAGQVAGKPAEQLFWEIDATLPSADPRTAETLVEALKKWIETGDTKYLEPTVIYVATQIKNARESSWKDASPLPADVITKLPESLRDEARAARWILSSEAPRLSLPAFAIDHRKKAKAMVTIDLIFFEKLPGSEFVEDLHLWAHELVHVRQFAEHGVEQFVRWYLDDELGFQPAGSINELEREADLVACRYFPVSDPAYIKACPVPAGD